MQVNNQGLSRQPSKVGFSAKINEPNIKAMLEKSINNPQKTAALTSTLISAVNANYKLQNCNVGSIISAALRGEIGMGLSLALGEYSIVPYGDKASFQISANGLKRLAIRSKAYKKIDFFDVRQGEYKGRDKQTREPIFEWIEDEDAREKLPIIGYYGFYMLDEENNGFFRCLYWTHEKILEHANRYSKAFSIKKYKNLCAGKLSKDEVEEAQKGSPWYGLPDSEPHKKMCLKTIAKQLLNDGLAPKSIWEVINADNETEKTGEPIIYDDTAGLDIVPETVIPEQKEEKHEDTEDNHLPDTTKKVTAKKTTVKRNVVPAEEKAKILETEAEDFEDNGFEIIDDNDAEISGLFD